MWCVISKHGWLLKRCHDVSEAIEVFWGRPDAGEIRFRKVGTGQAVCCGTCTPTLEY
jgi:hypothetical protein